MASNELGIAREEYQMAVYVNGRSTTDLLLEQIRDQRVPPDEPSENPTRTFGDEVFIVHGHDEAAKHAVARFVEKFDIEPIILDEQVNKGQTIIDKFEEHADEAGFAIVLLTTR